MYFDVTLISIMNAKEIMKKLNTRLSKNYWQYKTSFVPSKAANRYNNGESMEILILDMTRFQRNQIQL